MCVSVNVGECVRMWGWEEGEFFPKKSTLHRHINIDAAIAFHKSYRRLAGEGVEAKPLRRADLHGAAFQLTGFNFISIASVGAVPAL